MTVYAIAQLTLTDRDAYDRYAAGFMPILRAFGGTLLVADEQPRLFEGHWSGSKVIVLSFESSDSFDRWYHSPEYQAILRDRLAGAYGPALLVRGVPSDQSAAFAADS
jgi:uncharacterized protein (DUF1330 family)